MQLDSYAYILSRVEQSRPTAPSSVSCVEESMSDQTTKDRRRRRSASAAKPFARWTVSTRSEAHDPIDDSLILPLISWHSSVWEVTSWRYILLGNIRDMACTTNHTLNIKYSAIYRYIYIADYKESNKLSLERATFEHCRDNRFQFKIVLMHFGTRVRVGV